METLPRDLEGSLDTDAPSIDDLMAVYPPGFLDPPTPDEKIETWILNDIFVNKQGADVPRAAARESYAKLHSWNREQYIW